MLYDTWIYRLLNSTWFVWSLVVSVLALNVLMPVFIWLLMNGRLKSTIKKIKIGRDGQDSHGK